MRCAVRIQLCSGGRKKKLNSRGEGKGGGLSISNKHYLFFANFFDCIVLGFKCDLLALQSSYASIGKPLLHRHELQPVKIELLTYGCSECKK